MLKVVPLIKERLKTLNDADNLIRSFFNEIVYTDELKDFFAGRKNEAMNIIEESIMLLENLKDFGHADIEASLRPLSDKFGVNFRKIAEVLRIAIWGSRVSPPLFGAIEIFGKQITVERLNLYKEILIKNPDN